MLDGNVTFHLDLRRDLDLEVSQVDTVVFDLGSILEAFTRDTGHDQFGVACWGFARCSDWFTEADLLESQVKTWVLRVDQGEYLVLGKQGDVRHV
ncbi:hypothetical protein D3C74_448850 [compost metagenome]